MRDKIGKRLVYLLALLAIGLMVSLPLFLGDLGTKELSVFTKLFHFISFAYFITMVSIVANLIPKIDSRKDGQFITDIQPGSHPISLIKIFGNHIDIVSNDLFYRFPTAAFNGELFPDAQMLEVVVSGTDKQFKKLHLLKEKKDGNKS